MILPWTDEVTSSFTKELSENQCLVLDEDTITAVLRARLKADGWYIKLFTKIDGRWCDIWFKAKSPRHILAAHVA